MSRGGIEGLEGASYAEAVGRVTTVLADQRMRMDQKPMTIKELAQLRRSVDRLVKISGVLEAYVAELEEVADGLTVSMPARSNR